MLRFPTLSLILVLLAGCSGSAPDVPDVRFETRDAVVDPRDQPAGADSGDDLAEVSPAVDVIVFDAVDSGPVPEDRAPPGDASALDAAALDLPLLQDTPVTPCSELAESYATAVREAATCAAASECGARVCETLCCVCEVFVSSLGDRVRALDELRSRAERMGCSAMLPCPTTRCPAPRSGQCSTDGRCVTLREPSDAGTDR